MHDFDDIELEDLLEFLETGDPKKVPPKLCAYMEMLDKISGMYRRSFDFPNKEAIIKHLMIVDKMQRYQAVKLIRDALSYFAQENALSKATWKELIADKMLKAFTAAIRIAKNSRDFKDAVMILKEIRAVLQLDQEDIGEIEEDIMRQLQVLSTDITLFGEEKQDRNAIGQFIDALPDVPEKVKEAAKAEVDSIPFRFLYQDDNPRK